MVFVANIYAQTIPKFHPGSYYGDIATLIAIKFRTDNNI